MVKKVLLTIGALMCLFPAMALAAPSTGMLNMGLNTLWILIAGVLVLLMQGGFILLETGSTRMKNAGHVAGKTIFTMGLASIVYWAVGYGISFGANGNDFFGLGSFFYSPPLAGGEGDAYTSTAFFVFQLMFVTISLSIAWGGFAERAKLSSYLIFTLFFA